MNAYRLKMVVCSGFLLFGITALVLPAARTVLADDREQNVDILKRLSSYRSWVSLVHRDDPTSSLFKIDNSSAMG